jgi:NAD(P)-dependent dehydrogenase (short-subunit alcohol dehydrogenase family)
MTPLLSAVGTESDPARIIITCSVAGHIVSTTGERSSIMYGVSKAGCLHLTRNLAMELSSRHITSNSISPGFTETESAKEYLEGEYKGQLNLNNPLGRLARAEDMAGAVIYLCSKAGAYVNAVDITLDGGGRWRAGAFS